jgi:hypothetical protein
LNVYAISCDKGVFHNIKNHRETLRVSSHSFLDANGLLLLDIRVLLVGHSCEQSCVCGSVKCGCEWRPVNSGILPLAGKIIARRPRQMYTFAISKGGVQPAFKKSIQLYNISLCRSSSPLAALSSCDIPLFHDRNESAVLWYSRSLQIPPQVSSHLPQLFL